MIEKIVHGDRVPFSDLNSRPLDNVPTDGSNNPVKSDGIYDSEKDIYAVMGEMGAKNLIPYPYRKNDGTEQPTTGTLNGITWTINSDKSVTIAPGEATDRFTFYFAVRSSALSRIPLKSGSYKLTGCPSGGSRETYNMYFNSYRAGTSTSAGGMTDTGNGVTQTYNVDVVVGGYIDIKSGTRIQDPITFKPMLRLASDTDDTYQPYAKTNKQLTDEIANKVDKVEGKGLSTNDYSDTEKGKVADNTSAIEAINELYGAKNLAPNEAVSQTIHNAQYTVNSDGSVSVIRTSSDGSEANLLLKQSLTLPAGLYIMSDGYEGTNCYVMLTNTTGVPQYTTQNGDISFTLTHDTTFNLYIRTIPSGVISSSITIYPMIRDARIKDPTYVPYAMTNKQLTDAVNRGSVYVVADGVKTARQLLNELYALIDFSKITGLSYLRVESMYLPCVNIDGKRFGNAVVYNGTPQVVSVDLSNNSSDYNIYYDGANHIETITVIPSGRVFALYY